VSTKEPDLNATGCSSCEQSALTHLPARERIYDDGLWRIAHAFNAGRLGWLVRRSSTVLKRPPEEWVTEDDMDAFAGRITARLTDDLAG
jgi:hypothetical protein